MRTVPLSSRGSVVVTTILAGLLLCGCGDRSLDAPQSTGPAAVSASDGDLAPLPTVALLNLDLLRADRVGLLGASPSMTPGMDQFFAGGIVFEDASAPAGATYASATAIATGTEAAFNDHQLSLQWRHGGGPTIPQILATEGARAVDLQPTIAELLRRAGYRTVFVNDFVHSGRAVGLDRGFDEYVDVTSPVLPGVPGRVWTIEEQVAVVRERLDVGGAGRPSLISFHPNTLHFPLRLDPRLLDAELQAALDAEPEMWDLAQDWIEVAPGANARGGFDPRLGPWEGPLSEGERRLLSLAYDHVVRRMDAAVAPLLTDLAERGALVIVYANHGIGLGDHGLNTVGVPWQACIRVPWLVRLPGQGEQPAVGPVRVSVPVSPVDLGPTLLDWLALPAPGPWQGRSLGPVVEGAAPTRTLIAGRDLQHEYARRGDWKLIVRGSVGRQLYDLDADPGEQRDLAGEHPDVVRELEAALLALTIEQERLRVEAAGRR